MLRAFDINGNPFVRITPLYQTVLKKKKKKKKEKMNKFPLQVL